MNARKKTVIVTGASGWTGFAIAQAYVELGHNVVLSGRSLVRLRQAAARLGHPERVLAVEGDITRPAIVRRLFERAGAVFGQVDILVNQAGILGARTRQPQSDEDIDDIVDTGLKGFFYLSQAAAEHMSAQRQGHIVNITAGATARPAGRQRALLPGLIRSGLHHLTRGMAQELAASNVRVNAVALDGIAAVPGATAGDDGGFPFAPQSRHAGRVSRDIVDAVLYLTEANFTTGLILPVDAAPAAPERAGAPAHRHGAAAGIRELVERALG